VITSIEGIPLPWAVTVHSMRDANMDNMRAINAWFHVDQATDTNDVVNTPGIDARVFRS